MHIIVDIRTTGPQDTSIVRAGRAWADMWQKHKSEDTISYLIYDHQDRFSDRCIVVTKPFWPLAHSHIRPKTGNEVFRCVSFSPLVPYDTSIATTLHVVSNASTLYPDEATGSIARRVSEWLRKKSLQSATTLIVPDIQIGRELVELYDIDEESIEIIPHLPLSTLSVDTAPIQRIDTPVPYFIYDGGYAGESNILTLLAAWERYRRDGGRYELLLLGPALSHLSLLTHMIRSLDLVSSVRYLGYLDDASLATLYSGAKGWIYVGPYYSAGQRIELARAYHLPMLLSDIRSLREYDGIKVHPNHTTDIADGIHVLERTLYTDTHPHHIESYVEAYEKILTRKK